MPEKTSNSISDPYFASRSDRRPSFPNPDRRLRVFGDGAKNGIVYGLPVNRPECDFSIGG
jgi:hypothetical protein